MLGRKKHKVLIWCVTSIFIVTSCSDSADKKTEENQNVQRIQGETQGTTYGIQIVDGPEINKSEIDSILHDFDMSLSGYIPESMVNKFNSSEGSFIVPYEDDYFVNCFRLSKEFYKKTNGSFDPTVLPLMRLWGFLEKTDFIPSHQQIDSVLTFTGFSDENIQLLDQKKMEIKRGIVDGNYFSKKNPKLQLDFNAIAQGYSVDVLADYIRHKGCKNFYVEIGGEIYVEGKNPEGTTWKLGVDKPVASNDGKKQRVVSAVISLTKKGIATSGNYRKFYEKGGKIFAHTINPITGRPAENELLSATVVAKNAAIADAMATAFMVMGLEKSKEYLKSKDKDQLEVLFIYTSEGNSIQSYASEGMEKMLE